MSNENKALQRRKSEELLKAIDKYGVQNIFISYMDSDTLHFTYEESLTPFNRLDHRMMRDNNEDGYIIATDSRYVCAYDRKSIRPDEEHPGWFFASSKNRMGYSYENLDKRYAARPQIRFKAETPWTKDNTIMIHCYWFMILMYDPESVERLRDEIKRTELCPDQFDIVVNHRNNRQTDNDIDNLELCTAAENRIHASFIECVYQNDAFKHLRDPYIAGKDDPETGKYKHGLKIRVSISEIMPQWYILQKSIIEKAISKEYNDTNTRSPFVD